MAGVGVQDSRSMKPRIRNAHLLITQGTVPVNRHNKSPIDATRALIGRALFVMTLYPFKHVAVSLKLVSMMIDYSSPPASLVFDVFSCEQILERPSRMEF